METILLTEETRHITPKVSLSRSGRQLRTTQSTPLIKIHLRYDISDMSKKWTLVVLVNWRPWSHRIRQLQVPSPLLSYPTILGTTVPENPRRIIKRVLPLWIDVLQKTPVHTNNHTNKKPQSTQITLRLTTKLYPLSGYIKTLSRRFRSKVVLSRTSKSSLKIPVPSSHWPFPDTCWYCSVVMESSFTYRNRFRCSPSYVVIVATFHLPRRGGSVWKGSSITRRSQDCVPTSRGINHLCLLCPDGFGSKRSSFLRQSRVGVNLPHLPPQDGSVKKGSTVVSRSRIWESPTRVSVDSLHPLCQYGSCERGLLICRSRGWSPQTHVDTDPWFSPFIHIVEVTVNRGTLSSNVESDHYNVVTYPHQTVVGTEFLLPHDTRERGNRIVWGRHQDKGSTVSCHRRVRCLPPWVLTDEDTTLVSTHLESVEGVDPNYGHSWRPLESPYLISTGTITAPVDPRRTNRKEIFLLRRTKGRLGRTPYPITFCLQKKTRDTPIGLKDTSGPKDNEETVCEYERN